MRRMLVPTMWLFLVATANAGVLYKSIDAQGRVTYGEQPTGSAKVVVPIETDRYPPPAAPYEPPAALSGGETDLDEIIRRRPAPPRDAGVRAAEARLASARAALEAAQDQSTPEDWIYFPNQHRAPRPEYAQRLASLEARVKAAEAELADEERKLRLGY